MYACVYEQLPGVFRVAGAPGSSRSFAANPGRREGGFQSMALSYSWDPSVAAPVGANG